jgi:preprotein translocase subunit SecD
MLPTVFRSVAVALLWAVTGCPERKTPDRGTQLVYAKQPHAPSPREAIERRLARAGLPARLFEDESSLTVRVSEGGDLVAVKRLLAVRGRLELCAVDETTARGWCAHTSAEVAAVRYGDEAGTCRLEAAEEDALAPFSSKGARVLLEKAEGRVVAHAVASACLVPRLTAGETKPGQTLNGRPAVNVAFDGRSARDLEALTRANLGKPLLVVLDDEVLFAPLVMDAITGGKVMLTLPGATDEDSKRLLDALVGGPVEGLTLRSESRYGPPALR